MVSSVQVRRIGTMEIRAEVAEFAQLMERELRANEHKGGWKTCSAMSLHCHLQEEVVELLQAVLHGDPDQITEEAADVANMAMMIADVTRAKHANEKE